MKHPRNTGFVTKKKHLFQSQEDIDKQTDTYIKAHYGLFSIDIIFCNTNLSFY